MQTKAFTMIELVIALGIVAILAAIAVPNFTESQTRADLGRTKSEMRRVGVACETYRFENRKMFPVEHDCYRNRDYASYGNMCLGWWLYIYWDANPWGESNPSYLGGWLTSPVAYLSGIPVDPFFSQMLRKNSLYGQKAKEVSFFYWGPQNAAIFGWPIDRQTGSASPDGPYPNAAFGLYSCGPDLTIDYSPVYDPTNGVVSEGDIVYFGKGIGFVPCLKVP